MSIELEINFDRVNKSFAMVDFLARFGSEFVAQGQRIAQVRTTSRTGDYGRSFSVELIRGAPPSLKVGNKSEHAIFVEEDTVAHDVSPTPPGRPNFKGKTYPGSNTLYPGALRWFDPPGGGKSSAVFSRGPVHIPARKGLHIVKDAVIAAGKELSS